MNYDSLKVEIENACSIVSWDPSHKQIEMIINEIAQKRPNSVNEIVGIVASVCPDTTYACMEGIDNSDIRTLLALAIQTSNKKN